MYVGPKRLGDSQNHIENSDFKTGGSISPWTLDSNCNPSTDIITSTGGFANLELIDTASFKITGEETKEKRIYQTVDLSGEKGDTFTVASFAKATAVPIIISDPPSSTDRDFAVKVRVIKDPSAGTGIEEKTYRFPFNANTISWQYLADTFTTEYAYDGIEVSLVYNNQQNYAQFDVAQLYKSDYSVKYTYDPNGNLISETDYTGATTVFGAEESTDSESVTEEVNTGGFENDVFKGMKVSYSPEKVGSASENDIYGNVLTEYTTDGRVGIKTGYSYDSNGNYLDKITDSLGNSTDYNYNANYGTLDSIVDANDSVVDSNYRTTNYSYDSTDRLDAVSKNVSGLESGTAVSVVYGYNTEERLSTITQNDFAYNFNYDHVGNLRGVSAGSQSMLTYNYTEQSGTNIGNLMTGITYGNGQSVSYRQSNDKIDAFKYNGDTDWRYCFNYGLDGNVSSIVDKVNDLYTKYSYNTGGNQFLVTETKMNNNDYYHSYGSFKDTANSSDALLETINGDSYRTDFKTDKDGRLNETYFNFGTNNANKGSKDVRYDSLGRVQSTNVTKTTGDASSLLVSTMYNYKEMPDYNTTGQVYAANIMGGGSTRFDWQYFYTYGKLGNIKTQSKNGVTKFTYTYNELSQLKRVDDLDGNASWTYLYDKGGNIKTKTRYAYTTGTLGAAVETINYGYDSTWKDKLTSYKGTTVNSDVIGNIRLLDGRTFTWQGGNQLASSWKSGASATSYKYNSAGIRTQKTVGSVTTNYTLIGDRVTFETNGTDEIYYRYDGNNDLVSMNLNGTEYFYVRNLQNDIIALLDANGDVKVEYTYDSWGKLTGTTDTSGVSLATKNPYRYCGYRYDVETELYYVSSRYYSPELCRFISADDTSILLATQGDLLGANLFAYCANNPVMNVDPSGHSWVINNFGDVIDAYEAVKIISTISSSLLNLLIKYTTDVLNYDYATNWVIKLYVVKYSWFGLVQTTNIYNNSQLKRINLAKNNMQICSYAIKNLKAVTANSRAKDFTYSQIKAWALHMSAWDGRTFAELFYGTGIQALL
jgi:RHS repeat-associated protein